MVRKYLSFILLTLIAIQSVSAIADVHQIHQEQTQHLKFEHEHEKSLIETGQNEENAIGSTAPIQPDCHHCCHCHGVSPLFLSDVGSFHLPKLKRVLSEYHFSYFSYLNSPDIRPPIS